MVTILESLNVDGNRPISEEVQLGESVTISHGNVVLVVVVRLLQRELKPILMLKFRKKYSQAVTWTQENNTGQSLFMITADLSKVYCKFI